MAAGTPADLKVDVEERYSDQLLVELSNNDDTGATTKDDALILTACTDVIAFFRIDANLVWQLDDAAQVAEAARGVIETLRSYKARADDEDRVQKWRDSLRDRIRMITHNNRIQPATDGRTLASQRPANTRPDMDRINFDELVPGSHPSEADLFPPAGGLSEDS